MILGVVKSELRIDWASHQAARHAVETWHYSRCMPVGKLVKVGAWEDGKFIGVVIFGRGANHNMAGSYGLKQDQACELVRVALREHHAPVSRIIRIALSFLKKQSPKLELIISYADKDQGHHGGIYQAGGWIYKGLSSSALKIWHQGKWKHKKTVDDAGIDQSLLRKKRVQGKHTYLMPLTKAMKKQLAPLAKPYPKCASSETSDTLGDQPRKSGATPTDALQSS